MKRDCGYVIVLAMASCLVAAAWGTDASVSVAEVRAAQQQRVERLHSIHIRDQVTASWWRPEANRVTTRVELENAALARWNKVVARAEAAGASAEALERLRLKHEARMARLEQAVAIAEVNNKTIRCMRDGQIEVGGDRAVFVYEDLRDVAALVEEAGLGPDVARQVDMSGRQIKNGDEEVHLDDKRKRAVVYPARLGGTRVRQHLGIIPTFILRDELALKIESDAAGREVIKLIASFKSTGKRYAEVTIAPELDHCLKGYKIFNPDGGVWRSFEVLEVVSVGDTFIPKRTVMSCSSSKPGWEHPYYIGERTVVSCELDPDGFDDSLFEIPTGYTVQDLLRPEKGIYRQD